MQQFAAHKFSFVIFVKIQRSEKTSQNFTLEGTEKKVLFTKKLYIFLFQQSDQDLFMGLPEMVSISPCYYHNDCLLLLVMLKVHCRDTFSFIYGAIVTLSDSASHWYLWELTEHVPTHWLARSVKLPTLICGSVYGVAGASSQLRRGGAGAAWAGGRARGSVVPGGRPAGHIRKCRGAAGWSSERSWTG